MYKSVLAGVFVSIVTTQSICAQPQAATTFTYQGKLNDRGSAYTGTADFQLVLFDALTGGNQVGATSRHTNVPLNEGLFTIQPDFGADAFSSEQRWIEVQVRTPAGSGFYTRLNPRQPVTAAPLALQTRGVFVDDGEDVRIGDTFGGITDAKLYVVANDQVGLEMQRINSPGDSVSNVLDLGVRTDETPQAGLGARITMRGLASNNAMASIAQIDAVWTNPWIGAPAADLVFRTRSPGATATLPERLRLSGDGRVLVGRDFTITSEEYFGVQTPNTTGFGGMYINCAGTDTQPFYGYATNGFFRAYHHFDETSDAWQLYVVNSIKLTVNQAGNVGIGITAPQAKLDVQQNATNVNGVRIQKSDGVSGSAALFIDATNDARGLRIEQTNGASSLQRAALEINTTGDAKPVQVNVAGGDSSLASFTQTNSTSTDPAFTIASDNEGPTLLVDSTDTRSGTYGIEVISRGSAIGIHAHQESVTNEPAIDGLSAISGGTGIGVQGRASRIGVRGIGIADDDFIQDGSRFGVVGEAFVDGAAFNYGVYGSAANGDVNWAGYFDGNVFSDGDMFVSGFLSKAGGSFRIDHPLDPENKYLSHSFVESPDMMNIYNGNVTTDEKGYATVALPEWFGTLNRDFRYQLTPIGTFAQAIIAKEISNNEFVIQTDKPNVRISWQVTGIRQDRWANANRIQVEQDKPAQNRGMYLHPELYGAPHEMREARHDLLPEQRIDEALQAKTAASVRAVLAAKRSGGSAHDELEFEAR